MFVVARGSEIWHVDNAAFERRIEKVEGQYRSQLKIDRAMLQQARVIGQAFNKWIVVQAGADVVLVDQVTFAQGRGHHATLARARARAHARAHTLMRAQERLQLPLT